MAKSFTAQVKDFTALTQKNMRYVAVSAVQDVLEQATRTQKGVQQTGGSFELGKIPKEIGDLTDSLTVDGVSAGKDGSNVSVLIEGYQIGDVMTFAWTADYAARLNYGFSGTDSLGRHYEVAGRFWVEEAAAQFQSFVEKRVAEVRK